MRAAARMHLMCVPLRSRSRVMYIAPDMHRMWRARVCVTHRTGPRVQVPAVVDASAIYALMTMLPYWTNRMNGVHNAMSALRLLCAASEGRDAAVTAGVPAAVVTAMAACDATARGEAAFLLSNM